jgi:hypothetical protein
VPVEASDKKQRDVVYIVVYIVENISPLGGQLREQALELREVARRDGGAPSVCLS